MNRAIFKRELKSLALSIRSLKEKRKQMPNGYVPGLLDARITYRHLHIVYCLLRGRTIDQIEKNPVYPVPDAVIQKVWQKITGLEYPNRPEIGRASTEAAP